MMEEFDGLASISQQIEITARNYGVLIEPLGEEDTSELIQSFVAKFCNCNYERYMWEGMCKAVEEVSLECVAVSNDNGWQWIGEFINDSAIMFFNHSDEKRAYSFGNGEDIVKVLSDCYDFEFYVTNTVLDYVMCFSHHRILYATGNVVDMVRKYKTVQYDFFTKSAK